MAPLRAATAALFAGLLCSALADSSALARGWGDNIDWVTYADALAADRPICVTLWATWCGACKNLRPKVAESKDIRELAAQFSMVNIEVEDEHAKGAASLAQWEELVELALSLLRCHIWS